VNGLVIAFIVIGARFVLPLLIPKYPLPAILACLVLDAVDQTIFQALTDDPLLWYQSYDKALDIFYLSMAYVACMRNWKSGPAYRVAEFLFFYRIVGVALFEIFDARWLLFVFPNTFEYFFIAVEVLRLRWDIRRWSMRFYVILAAVIWIFIKLPQEWWIHIAQLDFTEFMDERPYLWPVLGLLIAIAIWVVVSQRHRMPPTDHPFRLASPPVELVAPRPDARFFTWDLLIKILLVGAIAVIFSVSLPGLDQTAPRLMVAVGIFALLNAAITQWFVRHGRTWTTAGWQFLATLVINVALLVLNEIIGFVPYTHGKIPVGALILLVPVLSLITALYDRYIRSSPTSRVRDESPGGGTTGGGDVAPAGA